MSDYIFNPPPPPPPKQAVAPQFSANGPNGSRGRGGNRSSSNNFRGRGGSRGNYGQQSRGGHGQQNLGGGGGEESSQSQFHQQRALVSNGPSSVHLNPTFFPQLQQAVQPPQSFPHNRALPSSTNPFFSQWAVPQSQGYSQDAPSSLRSYVDVSTPPTSASYGQFNAPIGLPSAKRHKPDMSQEGWLALNGGKLIGTNIKPPESDEEIRAWIAERKKRFPTATKRGLAEQEKAERKLEEEQGKANLVEAKKREQEAPMVVQQEAQPRKRKREAEVGSSDAQKVASKTESGEDDAPPEEISSHTRTAFRDQRRRNLPKKEKPVCKQFQQNGTCPRGEGCKFRHEVGAQGKRNENKKQRAEKVQLSLYQKLVEKEIEHENELMLQLINHMVETGVLKDDEEAEDAAQASKVW